MSLELMFNSGIGWVSGEARKTLSTIPKDEEEEGYCRAPNDKQEGWNYCNLPQHHTHTANCVGDFSSQYSFWHRGKLISLACAALRILIELLCGKEIHRKRAAKPAGRSGYIRTRFANMIGVP